MFARIARQIGAATGETEAKRRTRPNYGASGPGAHLVHPDLPPHSAGIGHRTAFHL
jgi:hypothetical protein